MFCSLLSALVIGKVCAAAATLPAPPTDGDVRHLVVQMFSDPTAARTVGRAYLRQYPDEADTARLIAELVALQSGADVADAAARISHFRGRVSSRVARDFRGGNTVAVAGWVLSRTEARLCAVLCLD